MYCPKCGSPNQDGVRFCRQCAEDLQAVTQVMKGHTSVAIASKLDAVLEKKNEKFRRDAILNGVMGAGFSVPSIVQLVRFGSLPGMSPLFLLLGIFCILYSGWQLLLYRRSLELRPALFDASAETHISVAGSLDKIYCPKCGHRNSETDRHCSACGLSLEFGVARRGLEKYLPDALTKRLDEAIRKNEQAPFKPQYKSGYTLLLVAFIYLVNVGLQSWRGDLQTAIVYMASGLALIASGAWNLIAYRRSEEFKPRNVETPPTSEHAPDSVAEHTTQILELPPAEIEQASVLPTRKLTDSRK